MKLNPLKLHYNRTVKKDLLNKFFYTKTDQIPKIKKIRFDLKKSKKISSSAKEISSIFLALKLVSRSNPKLEKSFKNILIFNLKKGQVLGCSVFVEKGSIFDVLEKVLDEGFVESNKKLKVSAVSSFSSSIFSLAFFRELETSHTSFKDLPPLKVTMNVHTSKNKELMFLLFSLKVPVF